MKLSLPPLAKLRTRRGVMFLLIAVLVIELFILGGITAYRYSSLTSVYNSSARGSLTQSKSKLKTGNANASSAGTISVPCGCKKQSQPGQTSTDGSTLQGGSSGTSQVPTCNPCSPVGGTTSTGVMCPEYLCRAPTPTPSPTPTPTPPPSGCLPCGTRESGATSTGYACPMLCVE